MNAARKPPSQRQRRVARLIRDTLAEAFVMRRIELPGIDLAQASITEVDVSPDLRNATIYIRALPPADGPQLAEAMNAHAGAIRHAAAPTLRGLKYLPRFRFVLDTAADHAAHIDALLRGLRKD